jgi:hypothetical protein
MIHTVFVDAGTEPENLKKEIRKKLMTGGAVIRIRNGLTEAEQRAIFRQFSSEALPNSIAAQVLVQLARLDGVYPEILAELRTVRLAEVQAAVNRVS